MNGVVLVHRTSDPGASKNEDLSPLPWMLTLPGIAPPISERQGKLNDATMASIVEYTLLKYVQDC